jgi:hypothetical protein
MLVSRLKYGLILAAVVLVGGIGWREAVPTATATPADTPPARLAPPPKAEAPSKPVALIDGGTPLTREEFADYLIRRYGVEKLEHFVNLRIVETACARKGVTVTDAEIDAGLQRDLKAMCVTEEEFRTKCLKQYNKNLVEWREDVIRPRVLMSKLVGMQVSVTDEELRRHFENRFGRKVWCWIIGWPKLEELEARRESERLRKEPDSFENLARKKATGALAETGGEGPFYRHPEGAKAQVLSDAAFRLAVGEVSELLTVGDRFILLKCSRYIPAEAGKAFESERPALYKDLMDRKIADQIPIVFRQLKDAAKPKLLLEK